MWLNAFLVITACAAACIQAAAGFGFAVIIMILWPLFLPVQDATQLLMFGW